MNDVIVVDLDGTLALDDGRAEKYLRSGKKDWDSYYGAAGDDLPNENIIELVSLLYDRGLYDVWILSGRIERTREVTERWLEKYKVDYDNLIMRPTDDRTQDTVLKLQWVDQYGLKRRKKLLLEDRQRMVDAWRAAGYTVLQVAPGNF